MAIDHGPDGIRVNCVCPGDVETPMLSDDAKKRGMSWEDYSAGASDRPLGRIGTAEEIARAVLSSPVFISAICPRCSAIPPMS